MARLRLRILKFGRPDVLCQTGTVMVSAVSAADCCAFSSHPRGATFVAGAATRRRHAWAAASTAWRLETVDLEGGAWSEPPAGAVKALRTALDRGDPAWYVTNHAACRGDVGALSRAAVRFFDQPFDAKVACAVGAMERSRGYEVYPQHLKYRAARLAESTRRRATSQTTPRGSSKTSGDDLLVEPSAAEFILAERYVMGPPPGLKEVDDGSTFFSSPFGRVFHERNVWPLDDDAALDGPSLRRAMTGHYEEMYACALATARVLAAALGADARAFDDLLAPARHHSRFQVNHYPSVRFAAIRGTGAPPARANAHHDTSVFTLLARPTDDDDDDDDDSEHTTTTTTTSRHPALPGSLEIRDERTGRWRHVPPAGPGALTCQLGSLIEYLTRGELRAATHRVRLPHKRLNNKRRLSAAFVLKPDYTAPAEPPPLLEAALAAAASGRRRRGRAVLATPAPAPPPIGLVGRVGWQAHAMLADPTLTKDQAKAGFKAWKLDMRARLGLLRSSSTREPCTATTPPVGHEPVLTSGRRQHHPITAPVVADPHLSAAAAQTVS